MQIDRKEVIESLGGEAAVKSMDHEARADALEEFLAERLEAVMAARKPGTVYPTVADHEARIDQRGYRRGVGRLLVHEHGYKILDPDNSKLTVPRLEPMPDKPTLIDFFHNRFASLNHLLQSATHALKGGHSEKVVLACLLHDIGVASFIRADHGYWGAQMIEPYVGEEVSWAVRTHQALRFFPDPSVGYDYPEMYIKYFGADYKPEPYIVAEYERARNHKYYMTSRLICVNDIYSFDPNAKVDLNDFVDIIGRNFRQPKEGLGFDNSPSAHMWRTLMWPTRFL